MELRNTRDVLVLFLCGMGYFAVCSELVLYVFIGEAVQNTFGLDSYGTGTEKYIFAILPSASAFCSLIGALVFGSICDSYGRRVPFLVSIWVSAVFGLLSAFASSFALFVSLRCLCAFGGGGLGVVDFVFFLETIGTSSSQSLRHSYALSVFALGCIGVIYLAALNLVLDNWKVLVILASVPLFISGVVRLFVSGETKSYRPLTLEEEVDEPLTTPLNTRLVLYGLWGTQTILYWGITLFLPEFLTRSGASSKWTLFYMVLSELPGCAFLLFLIKICKLSEPFALRVHYSGALAVLILLCFQWEGPVVSFLCCMVYFFFIPTWAVLLFISPLYFPSNTRGRHTGVLQAIQSLASVLSPFISSWVIGPHFPSVYAAPWTSCLFLLLSLSSLLRPWSPRVRSSPEGYSK